jgi:hypothetical protein
LEFNKGKPWKEQIKLSNFCLAGFQTKEENGKVVKPLASYTSGYQKIMHEPFIDREAGDIKQGPEYFKQLSQTIIEYANHPESKFDGDIGFLERKHIVADSVIHIGKEANNIDEQALGVKKAQEFINKQDIMDNILKLSQLKAEALGVSRSRFQGIKQRIRDGNLNLNTPAVKRLIAS